MLPLLSPRHHERFGIRDRAQLGRDLREFVGAALKRERFRFGLTSAGLLRPDLSLLAYAGYHPPDGIAPIFNLFDRITNAQVYSQRVSRVVCADFRGKGLSYDEHDGVDFVVPIGTPLTAAAPGTVILIRDRWVRGGLTIGVDHGAGLITQYTHCLRATEPIGAVVKRGQTIALSGSAGMEMTTFFPWVPPHLHFMAWYQGLPVDPYVIDGEPERAGVWTTRNDPRQPTRAQREEVALPCSAIDLDAMREVIDACNSPQIRAEIDAWDHLPHAQAAMVEECLQHDQWAWPADYHHRVIRPTPEQAPPTLTLPLCPKHYIGARFSDSALTRKVRVAPASLIPEAPAASRA